MRERKRERTASYCHFICN